MVKKAIVTAMAVISLFTLMGCNNRAEVDTLSPAQAAETDAAKLARRAAVC